jgi:uncharacterized secreted protein with C-terminal beta-propeller domain
MIMKSKRLENFLFAGLAVMIVSLVGCEINVTSDEDSTKVTVAPVQYSGPGLTRAQSCADVESYLKAVARSDAERMFAELEDNQRYYYDDSQVVGDDDDDAMVGGDEMLDGDYSNIAAPTAGESESGADAPDHSDTNNQELGVDEADFVKTDGNYIYLVSGTNFLIFNSWPADELEELTNIELDGYPMELFVSGDKVAIFSMVWNDQSPTPEFTSRVHGFLKAIVYDVSDRTNPSIEREIYFEGSYLTSRMIGSRVYLMTNTYMNTFDPYEILYSAEFYDYDYEDYTSAEVRNQVYSKIESATLEDMLPVYYDVTCDSVECSGAEEQFSPCTNFYIPNTPNGRGVVSMASFDLADSSEDLSSVGVISNQGNIYASTDNLYIATTNNLYWYGPNWGDDDWTQRTYIHKFSLGEEPDYLASGVVDGYVLNQFSMGEYNDHFRVATTEEDWNDTSASWLSNNVFVLGQNGNSLDIVGAIEEIEPGERIYAARFMGDRGFLVTFYQMDPLFTIDFSDPTNPTIEGELEMPGFSTYLHPLGDNHLIGIGQNADEFGSFDGIQLAIFDVSDMSNPTRSAHEVIGSGWDTSSEALYNHKAFLYYEPLKLLVIPVSHWEYEDCGNDYESAAYIACVEGSFFNGSFIYSVDTVDGFLKVGEIDHSDLYTPDAEESEYWYYSWGADHQVRRNFFIGDDPDYFLYSISGAGIKVNAVGEYDTAVASAELPYAWDYYFYGPIGGEPMIGGGVDVMGGEIAEEDSAGTPADVDSATVAGR